MDLTYTYNHRHATPRLWLSDKQCIHVYNKTFALTDKQLTTAHGTTNTINRQQSTNTHSITKNWTDKQPTIGKKNNSSFKKENVSFLSQKSPANRPQVVIKIFNKKRKENVISRIYEGVIRVEFSVYWNRRYMRSPGRKIDKNVN